MLMSNLKCIKTCLIILLSVLALAVIRGFEGVLFYDPFISYFKNDYLQIPWPEYNFFKLTIHLVLRYFMNSFLSILIIHQIFKDSIATKFASLLYFIIFILFLVTFLILLKLGTEEQNFWLFYLRRFLIHPVLLLLFLPAFYFQRLQTGSK